MPLLLLLRDEGFCSERAVREYAVPWHQHPSDMTQDHEGSRQEDRVTSANYAWELRTIPLSGFLSADMSSWGLQLVAGAVEIMAA